MQLLLVLKGKDRSCTKIANGYSKAQPKQLPDQWYIINPKPMIDRLSSPFPCITYPLKLIHYRTLIKHSIETPIYFIYLVFQLIIKNMDPYEPFYYPYNPLFPATLTLSDRLREFQKQEDYKKRIQADLIMQQNE